MVQVEMMMNWRDNEANNFTCLPVYVHSWCRATLDWRTQSSCGRSNTLRTMRMTSSKCVLQQRHLLGYESQPKPWTLTLNP